MQVNVTDCAVTVISLCRLQNSALGEALGEVTVLCVRQINLDNVSLATSPGKACYNYTTLTEIRNWD